MCYWKENELVITETTVSISVVWTEISLRNQITNLHRLSHCYQGFGFLRNRLIITSVLTSPASFLCCCVRKFDFWFGIKPIRLHTDLHWVRVVKFFSFQWQKLVNLSHLKYLLCRLIDFLFHAYHKAFETDSSTIIQLHLLNSRRSHRFYTCRSFDVLRLPTTQRPKDVMQLDIRLNDLKKITEFSNIMMPGCINESLTKLVFNVELVESWNAKNCH